MYFFVITNGLGSSLSFASSVREVNVATQKGLRHAHTDHAEAQRARREVPDGSMSARSRRRVSSSRSNYARFPFVSSFKVATKMCPRRDVAHRRQTAPEHGAVICEPVCMALNTLEGKTIALLLCEVFFCESRRR